MNIPISYKWLASHFEKPIPTAEEISRLFMLHLCEVEGMEKKGDDTIFDLKILPDRGHDLLAHKGIAHEVAVLAGVPMIGLPGSPRTKTGEVALLRVSVLDNKLCPRYMGRVVEGVKVGESPAWLRERLESVGQRSINNIVDITNFVMLELGQPMHAFDMDKLARATDGAMELTVRPGILDERMVTLDNKDVVIAPETLVIADTKNVLAVAGVKGGKQAQVDEQTVNIILEAANFDAVHTRRTGARIGIRTDSSKRFEHGLSPSLAEEAMGLATALLLEICPDAKVGEVVDITARPSRNYKVGISLSELNGILGTSLSEREVKDILERLGFSYSIVSNPQEQVLVMAPQLVGKPYKFGASVLYDAPETFDCSSLVAYLYKEVGVPVPRMAVDQFVYSEEVAMLDIQPGDLIFSNTGIGDIWYESKEWMPGTKIASGVDHVGLYLGENKVLHASRHVEQGSVIEDYKQSAQFKNIVGVRRVALKNEPRFVVTVPLERLDLRIKEDLAEEIGRVYGFHNIPGVSVPVSSFNAAPLKAYYYSNALRDAFVGAGFSEVFTYSFQNDGVFAVENPIAEDKGFLRKDLATGIKESLAFNARSASLLALDDIKIFEIGKVFPGVMVEKLSCAVGVELTKAGKKKDAQTKEVLENARTIISGVLGVPVEGVFTENVFEFDLGVILEKLPEPKVGDSFSSINTRYAKLSPYPFMLRDIALWVPEGVTSESVLEIIIREAGELLRVKAPL
jgi:phenylalanyl-tRNA synthetase beta subunit